jgi:hypothetical protein
MVSTKDNLPIGTKIVNKYDSTKKAIIRGIEKCE